MSYMYEALKEGSHACKLSMNKKESIYANFGNTYHMGWQVWIQAFRKVGGGADERIYMPEYIRKLIVVRPHGVVVLGSGNHVNVPNNTSLVRCSQNCHRNFPGSPDNVPFRWSQGSRMFKGIEPGNIGPQKHWNLGTLSNLGNHWIIQRLRTSNPGSNMNPRNIGCTPSDGIISWPSNLISFPVGNFPTCTRLSSFRLPFEVATLHVFPEFKLDSTVSA